MYDDEGRDWLTIIIGAGLGLIVVANLFLAANYFGILPLSQIPGLGFLPEKPKIFPIPNEPRKGMITFAPKDNAIDFVIQAHFLGAESKTINGRSYTVLTMRQEIENGEKFNIVLPDNLPSVNSEAIKPSFLIGKENKYKRLRIRMRYPHTAKTLTRVGNYLHPDSLLEWEMLIFFIDPPT